LHQLAIEAYHPDHVSFYIGIGTNFATTDKIVARTEACCPVLVMSAEIDVRNGDFFAGSNGPTCNEDLDSALLQIQMFRVSQAVMIFS
jgi:hypothetical protein